MFCTGPALIQLQHAVTLYYYHGRVSAMVATDFYRCLSNKVDHDAEVKRPSIVIHLLDKNLTGSGCKIAPGIQHGSTTGLQVSVFV